MYIVLFKSDDIYSKNMICKKLYRKMFNKHEIRDWKALELSFVKLELNSVHTRIEYPNAAFPHSKFI